MNETTRDMFDRYLSSSLGALHSDMIRKILGMKAAAEVWGNLDIKRGRNSGYLDQTGL